MKRILVMLLLASSIGAVAQRADAISIKTGATVFVSKDARDIFKTGFLLGGSYGYSITEKGQLLVDGQISINTIKGSTGLSAGIVQLQVSGGYKHQFDDVYAKLMVGYVDAAIGDKSSTFDIPRSFGFTAGVGYAIKIKNGKSFDLFADLNAYGKKLWASNLTIGVAYTFKR
jgi:hypothetical protein